MALTECWECGQSVSDTAYTCPHCGAENPAKGKQTADFTSTPTPTPTPEATTKKKAGCGKKAATSMVYIIVIGFIVAVIVIANSDSETPGSAQASQTTPKPTMTPLPTFTPKPPTATPSPTGTPISTATLTLSTACGWEDIADFDTEDVSNANVTRLAVRFNLPPNCTAQDMLAYAATHAALVIAQDDSIDAIGYFFFCDPEQIGFGANIGIDFAPYGDWSRAGETKKGDYGKHEVVLQFAKDVPCE